MLTVIVRYPGDEKTIKLWDVLAIEGGNSWEVGDILTIHIIDKCLWYYNIYSRN